MNEDEIPEFADIVPDRGTLDGAKIPIDEILNVPVVFTNWEISKSKYSKDGKESQRLTLQFIWQGEHRILFTGSTVLIEQIRQYEELRDQNRPKMFRATIRRIDQFYKFCRSDK